jgi:heme exporter protein A
MTSGPAVIEARGLAKRFGAWAALHPLDLDVARGETLALLGPNGAGKTTLLRLLAGLARPSRGTVRVGPAGDDRRARRRRVGLVGHSTFLYPALTARENMVLAGRLFGLEAPEERAASLLERLELRAAADRPVGDFSRGMAQRASIGRALMHDPDVLLLDEPFTGLDVRAATIVEELIDALREAAHTLVLSGHDLRRVCRLATSALLLDRGRAQPVDASLLTDAERLETHYRAATAEPG